MQLSHERLTLVRARIAEWTRETPLQSFPSGDPRVDLRLKLENRQVTGAFKARGAANHALLFECGRGLVTCSSGNHAKALAWAAAHRGVAARVHMPASSYPSKIEACRELGAEVVLSPTRVAAEEAFQRSIEEGWTPAHPYNSADTIAGQASVGLELLEQWPAVDVIVVQVGGGGLLAGVALACAYANAAHGRSPGDRHPRRVIGVEPQGADSLARALRTGRVEPLPEVTSQIQGLTPPGTGQLNYDLVRQHVASVETLSDEAILRAQARLVRELGEDVEPAGAAAAAWVFAGLPTSWFEGRVEPLRVAAIVSGGNAHPHQLACLREGNDAWLMPDGTQPT